MNATAANRRAHASAEWAALRDRLRTVTPQAIARAALTTVVAVGLLGLTVGTWPALLPFLVGGLVAYQLLPVVDVLDRFMPRFLAALLAVTGAVVAVVAVLAIVLPPLVGSFVTFAVDLPTRAEIEAAVARLQDQVGGQAGEPGVMVPLLGALGLAVRDAFNGASGSLDAFVRDAVRALLASVSVLLGLIVLPTWMLVMVRERRQAVTAIDRRLAPWLRKDVWAVVGIVDRAAGAYLRGYVIVAILVAALAYLGLQLSPRLGGPTYFQPLVLATLAGVSQVIPVVGPLLGLVPALLVLPVDAERAAGYLVVYIAARVIGASVLGSRLMNRRLGVHPAILVPGVVVIGQFGVLWLLLSAPIVAIAADLLRYIYGRLSEPGQPAGVLPRTTVEVRALAAIPRRQPSTYRRPRGPAVIPRAPTQAGGPAYEGG